MLLMAMGFGDSKNSHCLNVEFICKREKKEGGHGHTLPGPFVGIFGSFCLNDALSLSSLDVF